MGGTSGHVSLGLAFFSIGLWHLFNSIKLHSLHPKSYITPPWFPVPKCKYLEPVTIILVTVIFVSMEVVIGRNPISPDGSVTTKSLRHIEHSIIAVSFLIYALFAVLLDKIMQHSPVQHDLAHFLQTIAFGQQLLILHLHSTDHMGIEGQYHWLLQIVTFISLVATLLIISYPRSFFTSFVRSFFVIFQGFWLIVIGVMLWTPEWMPKGCYIKSETGREVVVCHGDQAMQRAKALVNISFGLYLSMFSVFAICFYLAMIKLYPEGKIEYEPLTKYIDDQEEGSNYKVVAHD